MRVVCVSVFFFFSSRRRHTRWPRDWSSDVCSSDLVPPLRERRDDVPIIARHFASTLARRNGMQPKEFTDDAIDLLKRYEWRGNVRELNNVVERLLMLSEGEEITADDVRRFVQPDLSAPASQPEDLGRLVGEYEQFAEFRDMAEKVFIQKKLEEFEWNVSRTSEEIGIQRSHLYNKMNKYGIEREE